MQNSARARLEQAKMKVSGLTMEAEAEGQMQQNLQAKRQHEERMASVDHLAKIMRQS